MPDSSPKTRWYHITQNNSGGSFDYDAVRGITHHMVIEATDWQHANSRALGLGLYHNGVENDRDCECCGDRWYPLHDRDKGDTEPMVYGKPVAKPSKQFIKWLKKGEFNIFVHPMEGKFQGYARS